MLEGDRYTGTTSIHNVDQIVGVSGLDYQVKTESCDSYSGLSEESAYILLHTVLP